MLDALAGPGGIIIGALAGAGAGRVATRWIDLGFADEFLERLQTHLKPNSSALILLVEHQYLTKLNETMASLKGIVLQQTLTDAVVQELLDEA